MRKKQARKGTAGSTTPLQARTKLSANGRIVVPAAIREELGFKPGEMLSMEVHEGTLRIESFMQRLGKIQDEMIQLVGPDRSLADELIAERREEARREHEEWDRERPHSGVKMRRAG